MDSEIENKIWNDLKIAQQLVESNNVRVGAKRLHTETMFDSDAVAMAKIQAWRAIYPDLKEANPMNHDCNQECLANNIDCIYPKYNLYGCRIGGVIHACNKKMSPYMMKMEYIVCDCNYTRTSGDGMVNCCYSGFDTGVSTYNQRKGKVTKSKDNESMKIFERIDEDSIGIITAPLSICKPKNQNMESIGRAKRAKNIGYDADGEQKNNDRNVCYTVINDLLFNRTTRMALDGSHKSDAIKKTNL